MNFDLAVKPEDYERCANELIVLAAKANIQIHKSFDFATRCRDNKSQTGTHSDVAAHYNDKDSWVISKDLAGALYFETNEPPSPLIQTMSTAPIWSETESPWC